MDTGVYVGTEENMEKYQEDFIHFCIKNNILCFGEFTLKSGRKSPYFFNAGLFNTGKKISYLGNVYCQTLQRSGIDFDVIFGPAYKGIPLACATASAFAMHSDRDMPWCFNRKEVKDHGEGGQLAGAPLTGKRVALIDDVITAGTAIGEVMPLINQAGGSLSIICIAFNRQELSGSDNTSAITSVENRWKAPVVSVICLDNILTYIASDSTLKQYTEAIEAYRSRYGATAI